MASKDPGQGLTLGHSAGILMVQGREDFLRVNIHMLEQARREICLLTWDLDKTLYGQAPFVEAVRALALRSHQSRIRILLQDPGPVVRDGHPLVDLARRLTSRMEIRIPHPNWQSHPTCFLLADRDGYLRQTLCSRYEGSADYHAPLEVRRLRDQFDEIWDSASVSAELRSLDL